MAVIDTGVDVQHPDLRDNVWVNADEKPGNDRDDDQNGYVDDVNGWDFRNDNATVYDGGNDDHGTHVAGTIAARGNNGRGVVGVGWRTRVMILKFMGSSGYTSDAVEALNYAVENGAKISNNSWGGGSYSRSLRDALARADAAGHLFVASAGNSGKDNDTSSHYPSNYDLPNVVSVAATDERDSLASFSNRGDRTVDLAAPGVGVLSTMPDNRYGTKSGTSMAAPHVAGTAALIRAQSSGLGDGAVKSRLLSVVDRKSGLNGRVVSGGRLNAARALGIRYMDATRLGLSAGRSTIGFGSSTRLSGRLTSLGRSVRGGNVILEQRAAGARVFRKVRGTRSGSNGRFSFSRLRPSKNTRYRVRFNGSSNGLKASVSLARRVGVSTRVTLSTSSKNMNPGGRRAVTGKVSPRHKGRVTLEIRRNGRSYAKKKLRLRNSRYRYVFRPRRAGSYTFRAMHPAYNDHQRGISQLRRVKIR